MLLPSQLPSLARQIGQLIKIKGPLTVSDYMKLVLTHPMQGFYTTQDQVIGSKGHFTTNPEISQMFGELIAAWVINEWIRVGSPAPLRLLELGPGRGTLIQDIVRVTSMFPQTRGLTQVSLVEISPRMTKLQQDRLKSMEVPISWFTSIDEVPVPSEQDGFTAVLAHEFFDALPIHKFQRNPCNPNEWHEVLVDMDRELNRKPHATPRIITGPNSVAEPVELEDPTFRFILSKNETPASKVLIPSLNPASHQMHVEMSPDSALVTQKVINLISSSNGCFLLCDYGYSGKDEVRRDTFRGFRNHQLWHPLDEPGTADLTADVDFEFLKKQSDSTSCLTFGPVTQNHFLRSLGIQIRLQKLLSRARDEEEKNLLKSGADMMLNQMGDQFKFVSFFPHKNKHLFDNNPPAGFV